MAHTFLNLGFEFSDGIGGQLISEIVAPFLLVDGDELRLNVGATSVILTLDAVDGLTAAAAVAAIIGQSPLVTADVFVDGAGDHVRISSLVPGANAEFEVLGGRAQTALAFPRGVVFGVTHPGAPWSWVSSGSSTATEGLEFDDPREPDFESYTYGYGFTVGTAEFADLKFFDDGLESFNERYNLHEPGWINRLGEPNPTVSETFDQGLIEDYDADFATPAPAFDVEVFDQGAIENYDADFTTPAPAFESLTFADTLAEPIETYPRIERGTHLIHTWVFSQNFQVTINSVIFTVTTLEITANADPGFELLYAAQLMQARINGASDVVGAGTLLDVTIPTIPELYLFPLNSADTLIVSVVNPSLSSLPDLTELTETFHFKDIFPPDAAQI